MAPTRVRVTEDMSDISSCDVEQKNNNLKTKSIQEAKWSYQEAVEWIKYLKKAQNNLKKLRQKYFNTAKACETKTYRKERVGFNDGLVKSINELDTSSFLTTYRLPIIEKINSLNDNDYVEVARYSISSESSATPTYLAYPEALGDNPFKIVATNASYQLAGDGIQVRLKDVEVLGSVVFEAKVQKKRRILAYEELLARLNEKIKKLCELEKKIKWMQKYICFLETRVRLTTKVQLSVQDYNDFLELFLEANGIARMYSLNSLNTNAFS